MTTQSNSAQPEVRAAVPKTITIGVYQHEDHPLGAGNLDSGREFCRIFVYEDGDRSYHALATDQSGTDLADLLEVRAAVPEGERLTAAARDVLAERRRQIEPKGYAHDHDDAHPNGEIAAYAAYYAMPPAAREWPTPELGYGGTLAQAIVPEGWPIPEASDRRSELVKAGALILAEIERIDRAAHSR